MNLSRSLLGCLTLLATTSGAFAATPSTNAPSAAPAPENKTAADKTPAPAPPTPAPAPAPAPAPVATGVTLDAYIKDLKSELKLSDSEKQQIENAYVNDGTELKNILNDESLSPLRQARKVSAMRDTRNAKIETLLFDFDRQQKFRQIEPKYRVALTLLAADGGLVASAAPAAK